MAGEAREVIAFLGFQVDQRSLADAQKQINDAAQRMLGTFSGLASAITEGDIPQIASEFGDVASGLLRSAIDLAHGFSDEADALADMSNQLGASTDGLQELQYAFRTVGVPAQAVQVSLFRLTSSLEEAGQRGSAQAQIFRELGIATHDADGAVRSIDEVMPELADAFQRLPTAGRRAVVANQLFGRAGRRLLPVLSQGSAGLSQLREEFRQFGGGATQEAIEAGGQYQSSLDRLNVAQRSLVASFSTSLLPAMSQGAEAAARIVAEFTRASRGTHVFEIGLAALTVVAGAFALASIEVWGPILLIAAALVLAVLAIDDFIVFMEGGKSVIGQFIAELFGVENATAIIDTLRLAFLAFGAVLRNVVFSSAFWLALLRSSPIGVFIESLVRMRDMFASIYDRINQVGSAIRGLPGVGAALGALGGSIRTGVELAATSQGVSLPTSRGSTSVNVNSPINIEVKGGGPDTAEQTRRVVSEELDRRNRQAVAALAEEVE